MRESSRRSIDGLGGARRKRGSCADPRRRAGPGLVLAAALGLALAFAGARAAVATNLPPGFSDTPVFSGLTHPTAVRFAPDGRVVVIEKGGAIKVFSSLAATTPTVFADLSAQVHDFWDRGMLGLALDPAWPARPYVYVLYVYDSNPDLSGSVPRWGDQCPDPPGANTSGCPVTIRLSRFEMSPSSAMVGGEQVLIEGGFRWCQQGPTHSAGTLRFGADGALYVSAGEGAMYEVGDYGQVGGTGGVPVNPCGDPNPPGDVGTPPADRSVAGGGSLRAQRLRRPGAGVSFGGMVLRVNPDTGEALPDNPFYGAPAPYDGRIVAFGLRNPFRFVIKPGTNEIWIGDVGWDTWEEIDRIPNPTDGVIENFGWPCYEGPLPQSIWQAMSVGMCQDLYANPNMATSVGISPNLVLTPPVFAYQHGQSVVPGDTDCVSGGSSAMAGGFYTGTSYPAQYQNAFFFFDYSRQCAWVMFPDASGTPNPATVTRFASQLAAPVDFETGPGGDLFYTDLLGGTVRRIQYQAPQAVIAATPSSGLAPLTVQFSGAGSSTPIPGGTLTYSWDLDGDGVFGDSTLLAPIWTYTAPASVTARLRVTDNLGASAVAQVQIQIGNNPPVPVIDTPSASLLWRVGDTIHFSGHATDPDQGTLSASALSWNVLLHHCSAPGNCHVHPVQSFAGVSSGTFPAPDHPYPSYLEIQLTATDALGLAVTTSLSLQPDTVQLAFDSWPSGLSVSAGSATLVTPFQQQVIIGSTNQLGAPSPQPLAPTSWDFWKWSDGGAQVHSVVAQASQPTFVASFLPEGNQCPGFPAPTTLSLSWTAAPPGGVVTLGGTGFGPNVFALLGATAVPVQNVSGAYQMTVPAGQALGAYPLAVVNPEGCRSTNAVTLTVVQGNGSCGLLGIEAVAALALLRAWPRRRAAGSPRSDAAACRGARAREPGVS